MDNTYAVVVACLLTLGLIGVAFLVGGLYWLNRKTRIDKEIQARIWQEFTPQGKAEIVGSERDVE